MAKKDNRKNQDTNTTVENTESTEEVTESSVEEESNTGENETTEESTPIENPAVEEVSNENTTEESESASIEIPENTTGRFIELIVHKDTLDRVTELLDGYNLNIIVNNEEDKVVVGPLEGEDFNNAIRIIAGRGLMFKI